MERVPRNHDTHVTTVSGENRREGWKEKMEGSKRKVYKRIIKTIHHGHNFRKFSVLGIIRMFLHFLSLLRAVFPLYGRLIDKRLSK